MDQQPNDDKVVVPPSHDIVFWKPPSQQSHKSSKPANNHPLNGGNSISSNKDAHSVQIQAPNGYHISRAATISMQDDETLHKHLVSESRLKRDQKITSDHNNHLSSQDMMTIQAN